MDSGEFADIINRFDKSEIFDYLVRLNSQLSDYVDTESELDYGLCLSQVSQLVEKFNITTSSKSKVKSKESNESSKPNEVEGNLSLNLFRLASRNMILILAQLPTKIYDFANGLLNHLHLNDANKLSPISNISIILLIDLFETYPNSLNSLINFSVTQIYKVIKKSPGISSNLIYLLNSITKNATKADIDDKFQAKLLKIVNKNIMQLEISFELTLDSAQVDNEATSTILLKSNYILVLKNLLLLSTSTNYEHLLALSTSSSSAGPKLKPEAIMIQQHQFQSNILANNEKLFYYGLSNFNKGIRIATVELLAHLFINFVPTGRFYAIEYLINQYDFPNPNNWDESLSATIDPDNDSISVDLRKEKNTLNGHDSESIIESYTDLLLYQTGIAETFILYIQLEQFQNPDYLSTNLISILDLILMKFGDLNQINNHIQNQQWNKTLQHWASVIDYIIRECGTTCHEMLLGYIYSKFNLELHTSSATSETEPKSNGPSTSKDKKRESIFNFKASKSSLKNKSKEARQKEIIPYHNPYQTYLLLYVIELLLPFGINFNSVVQGKQEGSSVHKISVESKENSKAIDEEGIEEGYIKENSFVCDILFKLLINNNDYIRNYALKSLLKYAGINKVEINQLILRSFKMVKQEYNNSGTEKVSSNSTPSSEENLSNIVAVKLMSNSLALSALIKQTDSTLLQNSTIIEILSFCTQNLKHNSNNNHNNFLKNSACWVILSSLVTFYNDSEFVKLNSSQFLVFWKSLLTSQYISSSLNHNTQASQQREIIDNLKLRNFSLICLLNYLNSVELTPESLKQLRFLITKSYNYLSYLESNIEGVGPITNFNGQHFNESDCNVNMINNIHYSNYSANNKLSFDRVIISLIFYSKKILLQSFVKLATLLKNDINSNMVIFLIKVFSDSKIFSRITAIENSKEKTKYHKNKISLNKINDYDDDVIILSEDYNYSFGITSKFQGDSANIDELSTKYQHIEYKTNGEGFLFKDTFSNEVALLSKNSIELQLEHNYRAWFDHFESLIYKSVDNSINYDPNVYLLQRYSINEQFSTNLISSLVDISIELFQLVFPYLSLKIQFSLLEQMRISLTSQTVDPLRYKAIAVNVSVAIQGVLTNITKKKNSLDKDIVNVILDIISKINIRNKHLLTINSDSVGLATSLLTKQASGEPISKFVNNIVNDIDPYQRGRSILSLARIYQHSRTGFNDTYNVILQLVNDPNPVVYHYSLKAASILLDSNIDNLHLVTDLLEKLYDNFLNDDFGYDIQSKVLINLSCKYGSIGVITEILKLAITSLGPNLRNWSSHDKLKLRNLIVALSSGIGSVTIKDYLEVFKNLLRLFQELIIFDPKLIDGEVNYFTDLLNLIISKNLTIGLVTPSPTSLNKESLFPLNSSFELYKSAYECYVELMKIFGFDVLTKESAKLLWISMNLKPCKELKQLITLWLESSLDINWFLTLNSLFKYSAKKLIGPFIEVNCQQKLLPLQQRQKKKQTNNVEFKDEEIENIFGDASENTDKNEPITWEFKLLIYDLLNNLLKFAQTNSQLLEQLKPKIQDIVKISFLGSTSPITIIKLRAISLLDKALGLFGHLADPLYPGVSILEQQQAQIISALIPCFNAGSDYKVIVNAINVSSKFISLPRIKFYSKQRILRTLIYLLEEISSNKFLRFGFLESMSEYGKKSIQISILNCWALLKIESEEDGDDTEPELLETLEKYSALLTSLWILVLREYSSLKYNENASKELEIYDNYWINFISVLSIELEKDNQFINQYLSDDAPNFFFILFSQCVESLIKNKNVPEILISLNRLVQSSELVDLLFNDEIFGEVIDLFDRLILIDDDTEILCDLIETVGTIFQTYLNSHSDSIESGFDKLFELIRVSMLPIFNILPFLRTDFDPNNKSQQLSLKHADSGPHLLVLKKALQKLVGMMSKFPNIVKVDLYSCLLFIFAKIYEYGNELLISILLPHLKQIITESKQFEVNLIEPFSNTIHGYYKIDKENSYSILTTMVLITSGDLGLDEEDSIRLSNALVELLRSNESVSMGIQCIKSLIQYSSRQPNDILLIKHLITDIIKLLVQDDAEISVDPKLLFEILFLFTKSKLDDESKLISLYSILIPLLIKYNDNGEISRAYLHERLLFLIKQHPDSFKVVVDNVLSESQKRLTKELVKYNPNVNTGSESISDQPEIQLKTFNV